MSTYTYERIGGFDNYFLLWETPNAYMHIAGTYTFEAGPLKNKDGGINVETIKAKILGGLDKIPRYRQKLAYIGSKNRPVWVDDDKFNLDYHIRHTGLPRPGTMEQLKALSARIMQQHLDRSRSLWEVWVIEGLDQDRFALVAKVHHCMVDGISGLELLSILMDLTPDTNIPEAKPYMPRAKPKRTDILWNDIKNAARLPFHTLHAIRKLKTDSELRERLTTDSKRRLQGLAAFFADLFKPGSVTPLNHEIGPHRHFDWISMPLKELKTIHRTLNGSLNDVVLTIVASAVACFLKNRRVDASKIDFRVLTPVSVRKQNQSGVMGNQVSGWTVALPLHPMDPLKRFHEIVKQTKHLKDSQQALGVHTLTQMADWTPSTFMAVGAKHYYRLLPWNMVVTNVPGPQFPVYLNGSKMLEAFPHVPLMQNHGLNIALLSYDGRLFWCFNADYDLLPDLERFTTAIQSAFESLRQSANSFKKNKMQNVAKSANPSLDAESHEYERLDLTG